MAPSGDVTERSALGRLALSIVTADLYDVAMGQSRKVYLDPTKFFALTYPTFDLREIVKDVLVRPRGENDKAVRQLELTYGGGKTHSLITSITWSMIPSNSPTFLQSTFGGLFCYKAAGRDRLPVPQRLRQLDGLVGFIPTPSPRLDSNFPIGQEWKVPCLS